VEVRDRLTGQLLDPVVVDRGTLKYLTAETISLAAGPAAGRGVRARMARVASHRRDVRLPTRRGDPARRLPKRTKH
jgi:hypothetical protein